MVGSVAEGWRCEGIDLDCGFGEGKARIGVGSFFLWRIVEGALRFLLGGLLAFVGFFTSLVVLFSGYVLFFYFVRLFVGF